MIRISVLSPKGGVGKSTIIYFLSLLFAKKYKTLIVDISSSATLSNLFGVKGNIIDNDIDYFSEKENLSIVSFSNNFSGIVRFKANKNNILDKYYDILKGKDILFVEYPIHINTELINYEYSLFKEIVNSSRNYLLPISDPLDYIVYSTKNYINLLLKTISDNQPTLGLVINRVQNNNKLNFNEIGSLFENIFIIKFYREMLFKGFWNNQIPEDIYPIYSKINEHF